MKVQIHYVNGSSSLHPFATFNAAMDFCRNGISYSGDRVRRVELIDNVQTKRPVWDITWNAISKHMGLTR